MGMDAESAPQSRRFLHVYTGNGKGKTTAAIGLAVRAAGAGQQVFFAQFLKGRPTSELAALRTMSDHITIRRFGRDTFVKNGGNAADKQNVAIGMAEAFEAAWSRKYSLIILDEIVLAAAMNLVNIDDVLNLADELSPDATLVLTGRHAPEAIIESADLVTEMKEVKHYYHAGVTAMLGIEV
jgi:cob(I)alamin adenosyltransferase